MALTASTVAEYNQDPKFRMDLEMLQRENQISLNYFDTSWEDTLSTGTVITIDDELQMAIQTATGHDTIVYGEHSASSQTFTVDQGNYIAERFFDRDADVSVFQLDNLIQKNGMWRMNREMDRYRFDQLKTLADITTDVVDVTAVATKAAGGNLIYDKIKEALFQIDAGGFDRTMRQCALAPVVRDFFEEADILTHATVSADARIKTGEIGMVRSVMFDQTINLSADTTDFAVNAKGAIAKTARTFTIDNNGTGTINAPQIGDFFTNGGEKIEIQTVKQVTANVEYTVTVDSPLPAAIADNATITISGKHTVYIPVVHGKAGHSVVQRPPTFEFLRDPDAPASLARAFQYYDAFLSLEGKRKVVMVPVKYRTIV